jgi:hypothetical protein
VGKKVEKRVGVSAVRRIGEGARLKALTLFGLSKFDHLRPAVQHFVQGRRDELRCDLE